MYSIWYVQSFLWKNKSLFRLWKNGTWSNVIKVCFWRERKCSDVGLQCLVLCRTRCDFDSRSGQSLSDTCCFLLRVINQKENNFFSVSVGLFQCRDSSKKAKGSTLCKILFENWKQIKYRPLIDVSICLLTWKRF